MASALTLTSINYKNSKWNWLTKYIEKHEFHLDSNHEEISKNELLQTYGVDRIPKVLPCRKKCKVNPWCLISISKESKSEAALLTEQYRDPKLPIGLQNTANTCWINSALQALFNIYQFRNYINSIEGFSGEESLNSLEYLLQAMFGEMELHKYKAMACSKESVFEKLAVFVTKELMQKDKDYEVLKCVSEFIENIIDKLLANPRTGPLFSSVFKTTLYRVAKWTCTSCCKEHVHQLSPDSCYTMAAYVGGDECPLDQCILDLQTETQTEVSLLCDGDNGCFSTVKVDRVVTPQIYDLPSLLIIRNNSLIDRELKRRLHVVYSDTLDLTSYVCNGEPATYALRAVIYHHGHWIKHFSAHVKTEDGKWFNFNDEKVIGLETRTGNSHPLENHKDYFSFPNIANKYKKKPRIRVSRGSFIWIYERANAEEKELSLLPTPQAVIDYVKSKRSQENGSIDSELIDRLKSEREDLLEELMVEDSRKPYSVISLPVLKEWFNFSGLKFMLSSSHTSEGMCEHGKFCPMASDSLKFIKQEKANALLEIDCGIHCEESTKVVYSLEEAFCSLCVARYACFILFKEHLKSLQKSIKKTSSKEQKSDCSFIGTETISRWSSLALNIYMKEHGFEQEEISADVNPVNHIDSINKADKENSQENTENEKSLENDNNDDGAIDKISFLNEDIICHHGFIDPTASGLWIPNVTFAKVKELCNGAIHPAALKDDFNICQNCLNTRDRTLEACEGGREERKRLCLLLMERKRPNPNKDANKTLYFLSKSFFSDWKAFVRLCVKDDQKICRPTSIENSCLICKHNKLLYFCSAEKDNPLYQFAVLIWEEEWSILAEFYSCDFSIKVHYDNSGKLVSEIPPCEKGCVEEEATRLYEEQFKYCSGCINIKQVHTENDVPSLNRNGNVFENFEVLPAKRIRKDMKSSHQGPSSIRAAASQRLVRSSKWFSSTDTIKEVQNFIAEQTGIWPLLQSLWLAGSKDRGVSPLLLTDEHRSMTLNALKIKAGDTIYFRAAKEDLEKAAGDGETEFTEFDMDAEEE